MRRRSANHEPHALAGRGQERSLQILRDSRSLMIVVIMPVTLMLLFGYGVNLDLKGLPFMCTTSDGSQQSQDLLKRFQASEYFMSSRVVDSYPA
jgi:ABC-2 type transport system permease protein